MQRFPHVNKFTQMRKKSVQFSQTLLQLFTLTLCACATIALKIAIQYQTSLLFSVSFFFKHISENNKVTNLGFNPPEHFEKLLKRKKRKDYRD